MKKVLVAAILLCAVQSVYARGIGHGIGGQRGTAGLVRVDASGSASYLFDAIQQGTGMAITKNNGDVRISTTITQTNTDEASLYNLNTYAPTSSGTQGSVWTATTSGGTWSTLPAQSDTSAATLYDLNKYAPTVAGTSGSVWQATVTGGKWAADQTGGGGGASFWTSVAGTTSAAANGVAAFNTTTGSMDVGDAVKWLDEDSVWKYGLVTAKQSASVTYMGEAISGPLSASSFSVGDGSRVVQIALSVNGNWSDGSQINTSLLSTDMSYEYNWTGPSAMLVGAYVYGLAANGAPSPTWNCKIGSEGYVFSTAVSVTTTAQDTGDTATRSSYDLDYGEEVLLLCPGNEATGNNNLIVNLIGVLP